jgi:hypothetical protein
MKKHAIQGEYDLSILILIKNILGFCRIPIKQFINKSGTM